MKVKELIDLLLECDKDLEVVNYHYQDSTTLREEIIHTHRNNEKHCTRHVILEFIGE